MENWRRLDSNSSLLNVSYSDGRLPTWGLQSLAKEQPWMEAKLKLSKSGKSQETSQRSDVSWDLQDITGNLFQKFVQVAQPLHKLTSGENAGKTKAANQWDNRCQ